MSQVDGAHLQPRHVDEIAYEPIHPVRLAFDDLRRAKYGSPVQRLLPKQSSRITNGNKGVSKLVRHDGDELLVVGYLDH